MTGQERNGRAASHDWELNGHSLPQGIAAAQRSLPAAANSEAPQPTLPAGSTARHAHGDRALVEAGARIVAQARADGDPLSQAALARRLRAEGFHIANERLRWLASSSGLQPWAEQAR